MDSFIFGYGTLIMKHFPDHKVVAQVEGFKRIFHPSELYGLWYPFVIRKPDFTCKGLLIQDKDGSLLPALDRYEGYPDLYDRILVSVSIISDPNRELSQSDITSIKAWIYVPSTKTASLTIDRIYKQMKKYDKDAYKEMMEKDLWMEKMEREFPSLVQELPALFQ